MRASQRRSTKRLTTMVAQFIRALRYPEIPDRIRESLGQSITDSIGCGLLGSSTAYSRLVSGYVGEWKSAGETSVWGTGLKASAPFAAMANSAACHAWDFDDTVLPAILHPGSVAGTRLHSR